VEVEEVITCLPCNISRTPLVNRVCGQNYAAMPGEWNFVGDCDMDSLQFTDSGNPECGTFTRTASIQTLSCQVPTSDTQTVSVSCPCSVTADNDVNRACDGNLASEDSDHSFGPNCIDQTISDSPFTSSCGSFTRTFSAKDKCGTLSSADQTVHVDCPRCTISGPPSVTRDCSANPGVLDGDFIKSAGCVGDIVVTDGAHPVSPQICGSFIREFTGQDKCGRPQDTKLSQTVSIVDNTPPNAICDGVVAFCSYPAASDNCSPVEDIIVHRDSSIVTQVFTVKDKCNNEKVVTCSSVCQDIV
jgi:hypothetical protein